MPAMYKAHPNLESSTVVSTEIWMVKQKPVCD